MGIESCRNLPQTGTNPPLSAVIPTLNEGNNLRTCLNVLAGEVAELIVVDGGSCDHTESTASQFNARWIKAQKGRGSQLAAGGTVATGEWIMFIHADTVLEKGWQKPVSNFINEIGEKEVAGVFCYRNDLNSNGGKFLERCVAWRTALGLPYGDQCLLIGRRFYNRLGGFRDIPIMEDVELVRRIGRRRLRVIPAAATTSGIRYRHLGVFCRSLRNIICLALYFAGLPPWLIAKLY